MRIISRKTIVDYYQNNPKAKVALEEWFVKTKKAQWTCFADMKQTFNSVDSVGNQHYVFNIHGNDFRLIVVVKFTIHTVLIRFVGTHAEYDKIDAAKIYNPKIMTAIKDENSYRAAMLRIEELLPLVDDNTSMGDKNLVELDLLSSLVADYEDIHFPISAPTLADVIKLRMEEMGLSAAAVAKMIGTNIKWLNNFFMGKTEPSFQTARNICKQLNIDGNIVLGTC